MIFLGVTATPFYLNNYQKIIENSIFYYEVNINIKIIKYKVQLYTPADKNALQLNFKRRFLA